MVKTRVLAEKNNIPLSSENHLKTNQGYVPKKLPKTVEKVKGCKCTELSVATDASTGERVGSCWVTGVPEKLGRFSIFLLIIFFAPPYLLRRPGPFYAPLIAFAMTAARSADDWWEVSRRVCLSLHKIVVEQVETDLVIFFKKRMSKQRSRIWSRCKKVWWKRYLRTKTKTHWKKKTKDCGFRKMEKWKLSEEVVGN